MHADALYQELNKHWLSTSRALLGEDVGPMAEYEKWLSQATSGLVFRKSAQSGKPVAFVLPFYSQSAPAYSFDEVDLGKKAEPLSINEIKDIDSILGALEGRVSYTGGISLGTSKLVEKSTDVVDSFYIYNSAQVSFSKYIAYCYNFEYSTNMFGCVHFGESNFCISSYNNGKITRCLEMHNCRKCSDSHYCHNLYASQNAMFSFNLRNANFVIGNIKLPKDRYAELKKKLLGELAGMLRKDKSLPSLLGLASRPPDKSSLAKIAPLRKPESRKPAGTGFAEEKFGELTKILFGKQLKGIAQYEKWLRGYVNLTKAVRSAFGDEIEVADYADYFAYPEARLVKEQDAFLLGDALRFDGAFLENPSFSEAGRQIGKIAYFYAGHNGGIVENAVESHVNIECSNCYRSTLNLNSKNCVHSFYSLESDTVFGCNSARKSSYLLRCCQATRCARCFEVDSSMECTDCYFCHDCENVRDSMFCFNTKNKTNAIWNVELPQDKYRLVKSAVLGELASRLEKGKSLDLSIFNLKA
ncbi:Uncharacterised protein [uncultured archaeon]|nr:Uncharacterised protein [uncultured archaeon]